MKVDWNKNAAQSDYDTIFLYFKKKTAMACFSSNDIEHLCKSIYLKLRVRII